MMPNGAPLIPYTEERFADRHEQRKAICADVARLVSKTPETRTRVNRFFGVVGSGKSWLMRRSQEEIGQRFPEILVWRLCLVEYPDAADRILAGTYLRQFRVAEDRQQTDEQEIRSILRWLIEKAVGARNAEPFLVDKLFDLQSLWERLDLELTETARPSALLVDGLDELPVTLFKLLEDYCLVPFANREDTLLILSMRVPYPMPHVWPHELKSGTDYWLKPFEPIDVEDQLNRIRGLVPVQAAAKSNDICRLGGGYPQSNVYLAGQVDPATGDWMDKAAALKAASAGFLASVDTELHPWLWALSVLQEFDEVRLQALFEAYGIPPGCWSTYIEAKKALMRLTDTRLVVFDNELRHSYTMDRALRCSLHNALRECDERRWRQLHETAVELYGRWIKSYPRAYNHWLDEAAYHQRCLTTGEALPSD
jgi:hypothetical protein